MATMVVKRGDIFYADLSPVIGSEQGGIRPVIIIQNDIGNKYSPTVIVSAITSNSCGDFFSRIWIKQRFSSVIRTNKDS